MNNVQPGYFLHVPMAGFTRSTSKFITVLTNPDE